MYYSETLSKASFKIYLYLAKCVTGQVYNRYQDHPVELGNSCYYLVPGRGNLVSAAIGRDGRKPYNILHDNMRIHLLSVSYRVTEANDK